MITFKKYSSIKCIVEKSEQYYIITILYVDLQRKRPRRCDRSWKEYDRLSSNKALNQPISAMYSFDR